MRSSPNANNTDKYSVCLKCHKNCKNKSSSSHVSVSNISTISTKKNHILLNKCCSTSTSNSNSTITECNYHSPQLNGDHHLTNGNHVSSSDIDKYAHVSNKDLSIKSQSVCNCKTNFKRSEQEDSFDKYIIGRKNIDKISRNNENQNICDENSQCGCYPTFENNENNNIKNNVEIEDEWAQMLLGLSKINPSTSLICGDPFEAVPTISVVPPTPDGLTNRLNQINSNKSKDEEYEVSPEDSPIDEEPPYKVLNSSLRRYGTVSSLEKVPSNDTDDKTYDSSEEHDSDDDIKVVTKEVYDENSNNNAPLLRNWTARAGSYVAEKMSFFEESKAFFDKYLGRKDPSFEQNEDEILDECTSGATSGEEVWGTPTSGGENEEMHMFNSDQTHSVSTLFSVF